MKKIMEMNKAYVELVAEDTRKAAYVLADKMQLTNFKIVDDSKIRIYESGVTTQSISKELIVNGVSLTSINYHRENLEDYFLKMTGEAGRIC